MFATDEGLSHFVNDVLQRVSPRSGRRYARELHEGRRMQFVRRVPVCTSGDSRTVGRLNASSRLRAARAQMSDRPRRATSTARRDSDQRETPYGAYLRAVAIIQNQCFVRCPKMRELASGRRAPSIARDCTKPLILYVWRLVIAKARQVSAVRGLPLVASRTATASSPSRTATLLRCSSDRGHFEQPTTSPSPRIYAPRRSCGDCVQCIPCLAVPRA